MAFLDGLGGFVYTSKCGLPTVRAFCMLALTTLTEWLFAALKVEVNS